MAVGHTRQKSKKSTITRTVEDGREVLHLTHAASLSFSAKSSDSELDSTKVSEMLNSATGGLAEPDTGAAKEQTGGADDTASAEVATFDIPKPEALSKSAKRRALLKSRKLSSATVVVAPTSQASELPEVSASLASVQTSPEQLHHSQPVIGEQDAVKPTNTEPPKVKKVKQLKHSKKAKSVHGRGDEDPATTEKHEVLEAAPGTSSVELSEVRPSVLNTGETAEVQPKKLKKKKNKLSKTTEASATDLSRPSTITVSSSHLQRDVAAPSSNTKDSFTRHHKEGQVLPVDSSTPQPPREHLRQKSIDVRVRINGKHHKLVSIETPLSSIRAKEPLTSDLPLKIKLPGNDVTFVYPDRSRKASKKHSIGRSIGSSISASQSDFSDARILQNRPHSYAAHRSTIGLESKLQDMILSHAHEAPSMRFSASMSSEPPVRSTRSVSPTSAKGSAKGSSRSAPPAEFRPANQSSPPRLLPVADSDRSMSPQDRGPIYLDKPEGLTHGAQVPAVPTLFESRPSQLNAPPSLGPPQRQNFPDQIPNPYQVPQNSHPNNIMSYGVQHGMQPTFYNNYYPSPQQMYNPYTAAPLNGMSMPMYEHPIQGNGMVYYNPDGTPYYPQEYYQQPSYYPNSFHQQQHYDY